MTTPDELQRVVEGLDTALRSKASHVELRDFTSDLRLLLSERAELLATVERMRGAVEQIAAAEVNEFRVGPAGGANICLDGEEWFCLSRDVRPVLEIARAALTTGEEK